MGVYIHIEISKSITVNEWRSVYDEALQLVNAFPLSEHYVETIINGIDTYCIVRTKEKTVKRYGKETVGWTATGDYDTLRCAEDYSLFKNYIDEDGDPNAGDAMLGVLSSYADHDWDDPLCSNTYHLWNGKTQGEPYHLYLLAIACLIELRLGKKAFVHGDITRGQCKKAVEMANAVLTNPIDMPDRCDMERHWKRVSVLPIPENEQLKCFINAYLGETNTAVFGEFIRHHFTESTLKEYWKKQFGSYSITTRGGSSAISQYLLWGFGIKDLCGYVQLYDKEQNSLHETFVKSVMDAKLYWEEKDCQNVFDIDKEDSNPYGIWAIMGDYVFGSARNKKIDRYMPLEQIRAELQAGLGNNVDVNGIIDAYLEREKELEAMGPVTTESTEEELAARCEQDAHSVLRQLLEIKRKNHEEATKDYDITEYGQLPYYRSGDLIRPNLNKVLIQSFEFYKACCQEEYYHELKQKSSHEKGKFLAKQNRYIRIRDIDWKRIYDDIEENPESFERYYPMVRVEAGSADLNALVRALILNDDLYVYCEETLKEDKRKHALEVYTKGEKSLGYCAHLAGTTIEDFILYLGEHEISFFNYESEEDFKKEVDNA